MSLKDTERLKRYGPELGRELLKDLPPEQQQEAFRLFTERFDEIVQGSQKDGPQGIAGMLGLSDGAPAGFGDLDAPKLEPDFDDAVVEPQLQAVAQLYFLYQYERMKVFDVADTLVRLFNEGRMRMQQGSGARGLYLIEKHRPLRYNRTQRMLAFRRAFNYGNVAARPEMPVYTAFHRQLVAFVSSIAQYHRDFLIGEVIRKGSQLEQRPFAPQATIQRIGADLRYDLDRYTYGNIVALTMETSQYLKDILTTLEAPDIRKAFDANNKWDVISEVSRRHLGGSAELSQRSKMASAGRKLLELVASNRFDSGDFVRFQAEIMPYGNVAEEWIAAYRLTSDGRSYRGVTDTVQRVLGGPSRSNAA